MPSRRADVFFYGLFMDQELLRAKGLHPEAAEVASLSGWGLRIGRRAALVPDPEGRVYGVLMTLTLTELERLYADASVHAYQPQSVLVDLAGGGRIAALCYNLPEPPSSSEHNPEYAAKLREVCRKVGLPAAYAASLR